MHPLSLRPLRHGFDTPQSRSTDDGLVSDPSVLRDYSSPWLPMVLGGWAAFTTLLLVDHMRQSIAMVLARRPDFNEFRQLTRGMLIAIFGDTEQAEAQRRAAWEVHSRLRGLDADGREWTANDPELTTRVFTILVHHLLAAQEKLLGRLTASRRDEYCAQALRTVGYVFGTMSALPGSYAELCLRYDDIIANGLTVTPETHDVFRANRALRINDVPMEHLVTATSDLLDPEVAEILGIDRSKPARFPRIDLADVTDDDLLPVACAARSVSRPS